MRILVTGGAGFIGMNLCRALLQGGHRVVVLDDFSTGLRSNLEGLDVELIEHDVTQPFDVPCDQIYHLACPASPVFYQKEGVRTMLTAFNGTYQALLNAERHKARILVASTSEVYGDPAVSPQPETYFGNVNTWGPRACYDEGKRAAEALCYEFKTQGRADVRVACIFNTYGPGMRLDDRRVMTEFIAAALAGRPLCLDAGGEQTRSFCYIDDLVDGLAMMMAHAPISGPVNLGGDEEITIKTLSQLVAAFVSPGPEEIASPRRVDDPMQRRPCLDKVKGYFSWEAKVCLKEGLQRTWAYFSGQVNRS